MFGIFPYGMPYFAQPQTTILLTPSINYNTPTPEIRRRAQEVPHMSRRSTNDKPRIKH